ncbi:MAG: hypothetical protein R6T87_08655 [Marinobacter sp.]
MLRYEAFTRLFALLGRKPDADPVEIVQTGLASMAREKPALADCEKLARHLDQLARELRE